MPEILLTPDMLRDEAGKLTSQKTQLDEAVAAIANLVASLEAGWHGKAQQAFVNSFKEKEAVYRRFSNDDLTAFIKFLTDYASAMETTDSGATSLLNF